MIKVEGLVKSFGENQVIKGIDATFEAGKTNLIIGRSGSGKTVFLKSILGLYEIMQEISPLEIEAFLPWIKKSEIYCAKNLEWYFKAGRFLIL